MVLTKAQAKSLDILEVARSLGMEMKRKSHREYYWAEHDSFKIDTVKNTWHWYSQNIFGDTINLVQQMRNVSYKEAMVFLETGSFPEAKPVEEERKPFNYTLAPYEQPFVEARTYLKEIRGLSDDTIDFFLEKGVLAQAKRKDKDGVIEDVLVFKYLDRNQQLVGASLQGLVPDQERYPGKSYLKQIMYQSEAISGLNVSIGSPKRLIVTEAPIDLMSYYELHKGELNDVRLVAMEGLKEGVLSHYVLEILQERGDIPMDERDYTKSSELARTSRFLSVVAETSTLFQEHKYDDLITLAVDRDKAGTDFITKLREKKIPVIDARPPKREGQEKTDWNDALRTQNQQSSVDLSAVSVENEKSFNNPLELVWELHGKWRDELAEKIREDLGINYELQAWQFEKEMSRFITTDLDKLFAKRTRLERDAYFADSTTSIRKEIDRLDAQILEYIEKAPEQSQEKTDWNDALRTQNQQSSVDLSAVSVENEKSFNNPLELVWELHGKWRDELAEKIREDLGINYELQAWQFEKEMSRFITTDLDKLFAKRTRLERDAYFADSTTSIRKEIDRLDAQILEHIEKAPEQSQERLNDRASGGEGYSQHDAVGSAEPEAELSATFEQTVASHPTSPYRYLHFSTTFEEVQRRQSKYHPITSDDLKRMNQYAGSIQKSSQWYLEELANSKIYYFYSNNGEVSLLDVNFKRENFLHLTGIRPVVPGKNAGDFVVDFAEGRGNYNQILVSNSLKEKLQVIPMLEDILDPKSFVLDNLDEVRIAQRLNFSEAIKSKDEDFLLLFKDIGDERVPASLMKIKRDLRVDVEKTKEKVILGVFRERDGHIEQLSINEDYVKDRGNELQTILKDGLFEEIKLEEQAHNKQELKRDADADGVSDEEELLQGTNPYDFRSKPGSKPNVEEELQAEEVVLATGSLAVADFIQNKDMAGLSRHLKEGIKEFLDSDKYKDYLTKMSHLNNYSNRNLRLILAQNPEASQVASFKQWKENFGRYVKKGEKALRIFKPMTKIKKDENNQPILDKNGKPETVTFFGLVPVFDVSQTEGKEMPKAAEVKEQLTDLDYANLYRALMAIAKENDVSVRFEEMENNKHGYYSVPENQIVLRSNDMNKAQIIKTFLHEMAHAELHHADNPQKENLTRSTAELQAESVAYVVSSYYGIDTSEYSFNYLSGWSADKETLADLEAQLDIVQQEAKSLMVRMDQALEQLRLSQEKQTKRSFEQKLEKFKDQSKQAVEDHKQELKADAQSKKEKGFSK